MSIARNTQGSNSIEGYDAELDDAAAVALGEEPMDATTETRLALEGYQRAMTYVLQLAQEPPIEYSEQLILVPQGERRGTHYVRGAALTELRRKVVEARSPTDMASPFAEP